MARLPRKRVVGGRAGTRPLKRSQRGVLASPPRYIHNQPSQLTSFVGRKEEITEIKRLLDTTRFLTLTGAAGCGKTRLALQVAADLLESYPDGVWLVELAALSDPALVPRAIVSTLGISEQPRLSWEEALATYLRGKSVLLLLDNCEHLRTASQGLVEALLRATPTVRIMATSREVLGGEGEVTYRVPSLSLPDSGRGLPVAHAARYDAIRLFAERAAQSQPGFSLIENNVPIIAQICRRLDGMPLAIEFAAARVRTLAVQQIAARLDDRFRLLTAGTRRTVPRHQTLRAAMDWSYDLLSEPERVMLRRLSVFAGGWTLEAAEEVCTGGGIEASDILDLLTQLVDKSLVVVEIRTEAARYRLLETVRQYGLERLNESGESAGVRGRHLRCYLEFAERADPELRGPAQTLWLERLETEHDNLRAALAWSKTDEDGAEAGLRLAGALHGFWRLHGHAAEGCEWLTDALGRGDRSPTSVHAKALLGAGWLAFRLGNYREARAWLLQALELFRESGDKWHFSLSLHQLAHTVDYQGDTTQAIALLEESVAVYRQVGDEWGLAFSLRCLGDAIYRQGDYGRATTLLEDSLALYRRVGDNWGLSNVLGSLGLLAGERNEYDRAVALLEESLTIVRPMGDRWDIALTQNKLANVMLRQGKSGRAVALYQESLRLGRETGGKLHIADCLTGLARAAAALEQPRRAAQLFGAAEIVREAIHTHVFPANRADYEHSVAIVQKALGERAFEAAWAEGRAMTLDRAIDYALQPGTSIGSSGPVSERAGKGIPEPPTARVRGELGEPRSRKRAGLLAPREREVAILIADGKTSREIAAQLSIRESTAETHVQHILNKLGFTSRSQIAAWVAAHGLVNL
jgi:predicted ATPase/DNA-binding CsgD family transcriptional regulator